MIGKCAGEDEYGFHGYNHEPMIAASWPDLAMLRSKLKRARALWESTVPAPMPVSWVPANNWYDADHLRILREVFPEISAVCSLFTSGDPELGEYREFGPEPWHEALLCLPRETCGYVLRPDHKMMMLSQIAGMGVWTHFVHPDDIYDIPDSRGEAAHRRNPDTLMWRRSTESGQPGLYVQLDNWVSRVKGLFPWLEFVTTSQAEARYRSHANNQVEVRTSDEAIEIISLAGGLFYVKTRRGIVLAPGAGGVLVDRREVESGVLHVVRCSAGRTVFGVRGR
jgi:hypothetical protein